MFMTPSIFNHKAFDNFFEDDFFWPTSSFPSSGKSVAPLKTDIKETQEGYELIMDLPGFSKDDLQVDLEKGYLRVLAKREDKQEQKDEKNAYLRRERYYGSFQRSFYVGSEFEKEDIRASFQDGVLTLLVPKKEAKAPEQKDSRILIEG